MTHGYLHSIMLVPLILTILGFPIRIQAQDLDPTIEDLVDIGDGMTDAEYLERLEILRHAPLDLNTATQSELEQLPWLTTQQAAAIMTWRNRHGRFSNIGTLRSVPGINEELVERLRPFLVVPAVRPDISGRWRITQSRQGRDAAAGTGWLGMQMDMAIGSHLRWGARIDRRIPGTGFRWRSGYAEIRHASWIDRVVVGHYSLEYGRGLIFGGSQHRRIDGLGSPVKWRPRGVVPARSSRQQGRFVGAALGIGLHEMHLTAILAQARTGGRVHGLRGTWTHRSMTLGGTVASHTVRDAAGISDPIRHSIRQYGLDFDILIGTTNMFGEIAWRGNGHAELAAGVHWEMGPIEGGTVVSRVNQQPDDQMGSGQSSLQDYRVATTVRYRPDRRTLVVFGHDARPGYDRIFSPIAATRTLRIRRRIFRSIVASGLWRRENRIMGTNAERDIRTGLQGQVDWSLTQRLRLRGRVERRIYHALSQILMEREHRFLADLRYRATGRFTLSGRWSGTYGAISAVPSISDEEDIFNEDTYTRWSVFMQSRIAPGMDVTIRYAQSRTVEPLKTMPRRSDVTWSIQITGGW